MVGDLELTLWVLGSLSLSSLDLIHLQVHQVKAELQTFPSTEWNSTALVRSQHGFTSGTVVLVQLLWDSMDGTMPGLPVHHHLLEFAQVHVHWIGHAVTQWCCTNTVWQNQGINHQITLKTGLLDFGKSGDTGRRKAGWVRTWRMHLLTC